MKRLAVATLFCCLLAAPLMSSAQESSEQMASYYYNNREFDKAIELYEPLYNRTQNSFYYQMLYNCYLETGQPKEAERLVEKRIKRYPRDLFLYVDLGKIYDSDSKKAEKQYKNAIDKLGRDTKQTNDLALAFDNAGRPDLAIKTYLKSRELLNNRLVYVMELATLYKKAGDYNKMMDEYFDLLDNAPGNMGSVQIALQRALNETSDNQVAEGLRKTLISRIRQHPDNRQYLEMMIWFSLQQKDFNFALTQAKAIDARFPELGSAQVFRVAQIAENNDDLNIAEQAYSYIVAKGKEAQLYFESRIALQNVKYERINRNHKTDDSEIDDLVQQYQSTIDELGKNPNTITLLRNFSHLLAYYPSSNNPVQSSQRLQQASDLLYDIIEMPRVPQNIINEVKLDLGDLLLFAGETWDAALLYGQVEKAAKNDPIGALAKFKNAKLSYYNNDFQWAKSQLDVLRASTSKLIANDAMELSLLISDNMEEDSTYDMLELYAAADLMFYRGQLDSALALLDDITIRALSHPLFDEVTMQKAKIRMKQGRYSEADSLLQFVAEHYADDILADDALFLRAELNEQQLNNPARARECYERILLDYPVSLYADRARKRYNALKSTLP